MKNKFAKHSMLLLAVVGYIFIIISALVQLITLSLALGSSVVGAVVNGLFLTISPSLLVALVMVMKED